MKKWVWRNTNSKDRILIDYRLEGNKTTAEYTYEYANNVIYLKATPEHKWHPPIMMQFSERYTWDEFTAYAQIITDRLNAWEVEQKLKGE